MRVRVYQPARTAMQSGRAKTREWIVEFEPRSPRQIDPLMGWTSSADTGQQVKMRFPTREAAISYCRRLGLEYRIVTPHERVVRPKSYADNFRFDAVR